jgi:hypothetical protein
MISSNMNIRRPHSAYVSVCGRNSSRKFILICRISYFYVGSSDQNKMNTIITKLNTNDEFSALL